MNGEDLVPHLADLRKYALALSRDSIASDDLVQECVARALAKRHLFKPGTNLRAWLVTILRNLYINQARHNARWDQTVDLTDIDSRLSYPAGQEDVVMVVESGHMLSRLPVAQRAAILAIAVDGCGYDEAGAYLGIPEGTVRSRVSRGRSALRAMVDGKYD